MQAAAEEKNKGYICVVSASICVPFITHRVLHIEGYCIHDEHMCMSTCHMSAHSAGALIN